MLVAILAQIFRTIACSLSLGAAGFSLSSLCLIIGIIHCS